MKPHSFRPSPTPKTVVEDQIAEGGKVTNRITTHCIHTRRCQGIPATGKSVTIPYVDILQIRNGKIVEEWVEFDMANIVRQISVRKD